MLSLHLGHSQGLLPHLGSILIFLLTMVLLLHLINPPMGFKFSNQPLNFYIPNLNDLMLVFSKPIRPNFSNQFITTLYSDFGEITGVILCLQVGI